MFLPGVILTFSMATIIHMKEYEHEHIENLKVILGFRGHGLASSICYGDPEARAW